LGAIKINYVTTDRFLAGELISLKLLSTKNLIPKFLFSRRRIVPILSCQFGQFSFVREIVEFVD
jgi:hypothetical protein